MKKINVCWSRKLIKVRVGQARRMVTRAVGDGLVEGSVAFGGKGEGKGGVDLEAEARIISILDQQANAVYSIFQHLFEAGATVARGGLGLPAHIGQACRQPY